MRPYESQPPLAGSSNPKDYLKEYGFVRRITARSWFAWILSLLIMAAGIALIYLFKQSIGDLLGPLIFFAGFLFGLIQWRTAKQEISMDKFYDRLDRANALYKDPEVKKEMGFPAGPEATMLLYVCTELDNLEYVVEKYRIGYIGEEQACRGLKTFQERCIRSRRFQEIARARVHEGDYTTTTAKVVCTVCDAVDEMIERGRVARLSWAAAG